MLEEPQLSTKSKLDSPATIIPYDNVIDTWPARKRDIAHRELPEADSITEGPGPALTQVKPDPV